MSERRRALLAALTAAVLFVLAFVTTLGPWLTRERQIISSTPTTLSAARLTDLRLPAKAVLCVAGFGLDETAEGLQLRTRDVKAAGPTPPLRVEVRAPGYRSTGRLASGYPEDVAVVVALRPPARDVDGAQVCIRNEGKAIGLVATVEPRELAPVEVRLDGRPVEAQPWLTFVELRRASILSRSGELLARISAFRPFPAQPLLLGLLAVLVLIGVPVALVAALALAGRADDTAR